MSILFSSSNKWFFSVKLMFISTAVMSMAVILKFSVPVMVDFATSEVPLIWSIILTWLRPPYVYILINCIIISIVASSKIQKKSVVEDSRSVIMALQTAETKVPEDVVPIESVALDGVVSRGFEYDSSVAKEKDVVMVEPEVVSDLEVVRAAVMETEVKIMTDGDQFVETRKAPDLERKESLEIPIWNEKEEKKPPVSARFAHRKMGKVNLEGGKALGVSKSKKQDTFENTWRKITEGRSMPLTRHLKKSDTWEQHPGRRHGNSIQTNDENSNSNSNSVFTVKKSETFSERTPAANSSLTRSSGSGKLKKEPSLSQDELNRRVEAFIKKFNEEMRLQRQESLNQYKEMMSRGVH